ncbi:MAG: hypothetical protein ABR597_09720 [Bacteroidales bacterium]
MNRTFRSVIMWVLALVITLAAVVYQRMTGPTYPVRGKVSIENEDIRYRLIRSYPHPEDAPVKVEVENRNINGSFIYKRTPSHDEWTREDMVRDGDYLIAYIPQQPPAGKLMYQITLESDNERIKLTENPVFIRFRGDVPAFVVIPHIIIIFMAMLLSTRAGIAAILKEKTYKLTLWTLITLLVGGLIFGPIMQKYAFGAWWTGWPFGTDLTDNKTAVAFLFWAYAMVKVYKNRYHRGWVFAAAIITLMVFLIPHSMLGSEIDWTREAIP